MVFLVLTALFGIMGTESTIIGMNAIRPVRKPLVPGWTICVAGIALYAVLFFVTGKLMNRPVTTELLLITGWLVLELCMVNSLAAGGMAHSRIVWMIVIILASWVISMILYMVYYHMEEQKAYYAAMVPLITEAVGMAGCLMFICL